MAEFEKAARLNAYGVSVLGALIASIDISGVYSIAGLVGYGVWNILYLAVAISLYLAFRQRRLDD